MSRVVLAAALCGLVLLTRGGVRAGCDRPSVCAEVGAPCDGDGDCPPGYACTGGECRGAACAVTADCALGADCVRALGGGTGTCVCGGCVPWHCPLGCTLGVRSGCRCESIDDCPSEDDVCFQGVCS